MVDMASYSLVLSLDILVILYSFQQDQILNLTIFTHFI